MLVNTFSQQYNKFIDFMVRKFVCVKKMFFKFSSNFT